MTSLQPSPVEPGITPNSPSASHAAAPGSLLELVLRSLDDDQAQEVVSIPLEGKSSVADHMVIASGRSPKTSIPMPTPNSRRE